MPGDVRHGCLHRRSLMLSYERMSWSDVMKPTAVDGGASGGAHELRIFWPHRECE
jgi:hypothetical protein